MRRSRRPNGVRGNFPDPDAATFLSATKGTQWLGVAPVFLSTPFPHPIRRRRWMVVGCTGHLLDSQVTMCLFPNREVTRLASRRHFLLDMAPN